MIKVITKHIKIYKDIQITRKVETRTSNMRYLKIYAYL